MTTKTKILDACMNDTTVATNNFTREDLLTLPYPAGFGGMCNQIYGDGGGEDGALDIGDKMADGKTCCVPSNTKSVITRARYNCINDNPDVNPMNIVVIPDHTTKPNTSCDTLMGSGNYTSKTYFEHECCVLNTTPTTTSTCASTTVFWIVIAILALIICVFLFRKRKMFF